MVIKRDKIFEITADVPETKDKKGKKKWMIG